MQGFDPSCIDVEDYLDCLSIRNVEKATENEVRFSCPLSAHASGDSSPSAYMNIHTTAFFCHSCHAKGNAITLASALLGTSPIHTTRMLKQRYSPGGIDPDSRCMVEEVRKLILSRDGCLFRQNKILDESVLDYYKVSWKQHSWHIPSPYATYMFNRGFSVDVLEKWGFGYHAKKNLVTLPIRDECGRLVGIKGRVPDDVTKPKYLNLSDPSNGVEPYLKNEIVFALDRANRISNLTQQELIIVEGEYNCIAMHTLGYENTVAISGSHFSDRQLKLVKRFTDKAILFFDSDDAGYHATREVSKALTPFIDVSICPDHHGDPMVMHKYSIESCIREARSAREILAVH